MVSIARAERVRKGIAHLLVNVELAEDFGGIKEVGVIHDPRVAS